MSELSQRHVAYVMRSAPYAAVHKETGRGYVFDDVHKAALMLWGRSLSDFSFLCYGHTVEVIGDELSEVERSWNEARVRCLSSIPSPPRGDLPDPFGGRPDLFGG